MRTEPRVAMSNQLVLTTRGALQRALLLFAFLLALLTGIWLALGSPNSFRAKRSGYRAYRDVALRTIIEDLENHGVIPAGTSWESDDLEQRRITVKWLWATGIDALGQVAAAAQVDVAYPAGYHGELLGPCRIQQPTSAKPGLRPYRPSQKPHTWHTPSLGRITCA